MGEELERVLNANNFTLIAGPCVIESKENVMFVAKR